MSDELVRLTGADLVVEIAPTVGARVHRVEAFGGDVLRTPSSVAQHRRDPFFWGAYVMAPWCNRAPAGPVRLGSAVVDLEANFPDGSAIHGLVHDQPWQREAVSAWRIDRPAGRWPWPHTVRVGYTVVGASLVVDLAVANLGDTDMPAGIGWHPWFRAPVEVAIPSSTVFESNVASSATPLTAAGRFDRRELGPLPADLDASWTDLTVPDVVLSWPDVGVRATMTLSDALGFVVAAAPSGLGAVAVEAQTHGPDGIRRLVAGEPGSPGSLAPGESLDARIELAFTRG